jgi:hypothetical protein
MLVSYHNTIRHHNPDDLDLNINYSPQRAAQRISELNLFLYLRISGVSEPTSCDVGVTFTLTCDSRRVGPEPPAPNPNVRNERCFCWRGWGGDLDTAWRYWKPKHYPSIHRNRRRGKRKKKNKRSAYISSRISIHQPIFFQLLRNNPSSKYPHLQSFVFTYVTP